MTVGEVVSKSTKRLYNRISNCSLESLSIWGERKTQNFFIFVGNETNPFKLHSVFFELLKLILKKTQQTYESE